MTKAWFEEELDFSNDVVVEVATILFKAYPSKERFDALVENVGLHPGMIENSSRHDLYVRNAMKYAWGAKRLARLLAELLRDDDLVAYADQLAPYVKGHEANLHAAIRTQKPSLALLARRPLGQLRNGRDALISLGDLEKVINGAAGYADVRKFRRGLAEGEVRTARILVDGRANGTGFLVGKNILLTAWHVVGGAAVKLEAQFDYAVDEFENTIHQGRTVPFATDWELASSRHAPLEDELGADGPSNKLWDYALVRLSADVGVQPIGDPAEKGDKRGFWKLDGSAYAFDVGEPILIVGHPDKRPMQLSYASPSGAVVTKHPTRVRYQTNTEGGSSGSPVFNKHWRIVALHHASGPTEDPHGPLDKTTTDFNQGVPIAEIVADLKAKAKEPNSKLTAEVLTELGIKSDDGKPSDVRVGSPQGDISRVSLGTESLSSEPSTPPDSADTSTSTPTASDRRVAPQRNDETRQLVEVPAHTTTHSGSQQPTHGKFSKYALIGGLSAAMLAFVPVIRTCQTEPQRRVLLIVLGPGGSSMIDREKVSPFVLSIDSRILPIPADGLIIGDHPGSIPDHIRMRATSANFVTLKLTEQKLSRSEVLFDGSHCDLNTEGDIWVVDYSACK